MSAAGYMTAVGIAVLKDREGVRLSAYLDSVGVPTIGYGRTKGVKLGQRITQAQADAYFLEDLAEHAAPVLAAVRVPLADHEQDALVSIAFNIGTGAFKRSTFLKRLNAGDRAGCATAIMQWRKPAGIITRRTAERDQFLTPYSVAMPKARSDDRTPTPRVRRPAPKPPVPVIEAHRVETVVPVTAEKLPWWARLFGRGPKTIDVIPPVSEPGWQFGSRPGLSPKGGSPRLWDVQKALRDRNYYTKGFLDGLDGPLTQSAVAQARKENGLGDGGVDDAFLRALPTMPLRPVSTDRANIGLGGAAAHVPEVFNPLKWVATLGAGAAGLGGADSTGLLDTIKSGADRVNDVAGSAQTAIGVAANAVEFLVEQKGLILLALGLYAVFWAGGKALDGWIKVRQAFF